MPEAIRCCFFVPCYSIIGNCLTYSCQVSLLQLLIHVWASYRHFYLDRLPEAIYCCLQTYTVYDVLLIMYFMCLPVFLSLVKAVMSVYMLFTNILPEAIFVVV